MRGTDASLVIGRWVAGAGGRLPIGGPMAVSAPALRHRDLPGRRAGRHRRRGAHSHPLVDIRSL